MRILVKFAYLGWKFTGYQRGNGDRSVEDSILEVINEKQLGHGFRSAARTDRGVSALGNVFSIDSELNPKRITGILNSSSEDIVFHHHAIVEDGFDCRKCTSKQYTYTISRDSVDPDSFRERVKLFAGTHDYASFCRKDGRNTTRSIDRIEVREDGPLILVDFHSRGFLWNQLRSIVAYAATKDEKYSGDPFKIEGRFPYLWGTEGLYLVDITYGGIEFTRSISRKLALRQRSAAIRSYTDSRIMESLSTY
ncbi:MAG: pseudouridine synthase family protein [Thermoplasmataceae archaeon]